MVNLAAPTGTIFWCAGAPRARVQPTRPRATISSVESYLVDFDDLERIDVWGETVKARALHGERVTIALVELAPDAVVPEHRHDNEQMGVVITGQMTFTIDGETRTLGVGGTWQIPSGRPHDAVAGPDGALVVDVFAPARHDWDVLPHEPPTPVDWPGR